jgi:hypothetical protein
VHLLGKHLENEYIPKGGRVGAPASGYCDIVANAGNETDPMNLKFANRRRVLAALYRKF